MSEMLECDVDEYTACRANGYRATIATQRAEIQAQAQRIASLERDRNELALSVVDKQSELDDYRDKWKLANTHAADYKTERDAAREDAAMLRAALESVKWKPDREDDAWSRCNSCHQFKNQGHAPRCIVAAALSAAASQRRETDGERRRALMEAADLMDELDAEWWTNEGPAACVHSAGNAIRERLLAALDAAQQAPRGGAE